MPTTSSDTIFGLRLGHEPIEPTTLAGRFLTEGKCPLCMKRTLSRKKRIRTYPFAAIFSTAMRKLVAEWTSENNKVHSKNRNLRAPQFTKQEIRQTINYVRGFLKPTHSDPDFYAFSIFFEQSCRYCKAQFTYQRTIINERRRI